MSKEPIGWITVNGVHVPLFDGESKDESIAKALERKKESEIKQHEAEKAKINKEKAAPAQPSSVVTQSWKSSRKANEIEKEYAKNKTDELNEALKNVSGFKGKAEVFYDGDRLANHPFMMRFPMSNFSGRFGYSDVSKSTVMAAIRKTLTQSKIKPTQFYAITKSGGSTYFEMAFTPHKSELTYQL